MKQFQIALFISLTFWQTAYAQQPNIVKKRFHLFLLARQSNMAGRGKVEDTLHHHRIWVLTKNNDWQLAAEPLHFDKPSVVGVGIGFAFAKKMAELDTNIVIGLIPCAVGGSPIDTWEKGKFFDQTKSFPYDDTLKRTKIALEKGKLKGILWQQGESDSDSIRAKVYGKNLEILVRRFRKDLKNRHLPFVAGTIAEFYSDKKPYAKIVNQGIEALPTNVKNTATVNASGLKHKGDDTHFDSPSARELGRRYAAVFQKFK